SYSDSAHRDKEAFVREYVGETKPAVLIDVGCNDGAYSRIALDAGAHSVIGIEMDREALDRAFLCAKRHSLPFTSVIVDLVNPSPAMGWRGTERQSLADRLYADGLIGLAVIHH